MIRDKNGFTRASYHNSEHHSLLLLTRDVVHFRKCRIITLRNRVVSLLCGGSHSQLVLSGQREEAGGGQSLLHPRLGGGVEARQRRPLLALRDAVLLAEGVDLLGIQVQSWSGAVYVYAYVYAYVYMYIYVTNMSVIFIGNVQ